MTWRIFMLLGDQISRWHPKPSQLKIIMPRSRWRSPYFYFVPPPKNCTTKSLKWFEKVWPLDICICPKEKQKQLLNDREKTVFNLLSAELVINGSAINNANNCRLSRDFPKKRRGSWGRKNGRGAVKATRQIGYKQQQILEGIVPHDSQTSGCLGEYQGSSFSKHVHNNEAIMMIVALLVFSREPSFLLFILLSFTKPSLSLSLSFSFALEFYLIDHSNNWPSSCHPQCLNILS